MANDFIAYVEKSTISKILTSFFRYTNFIHPSMKLDIKKITETENGGHFRVEGDLLDDEEYKGE